MTGSGQPDYPIKVINLDRDRDRLARMERWYGEIGVAFDRVPAILGATIRDPIRYALIRPGRKAQDGTLGCALSHFGAWLEIANGPDGHVLVLEDDARPLRPLPTRFAELGLPGKYELCFVNRRMVPKGERGRGSQPTFMPLVEALLARAAGQRGYGADGYFLSRKGAEKLLRAFHRDRFLSHVDQQMIAAGLPAEDLTRIAAARDDLDPIRRIAQRRLSGHTCRMFVMIPPLVSQRDDGVSTRTGRGRDRPAEEVLHSGV